MADFELDCSADDADVSFLVVSDDVDSEIRSFANSVSSPGTSDRAGEDKGEDKHWAASRSQYHHGYQNGLSMLILTIIFKLLYTHGRDVLNIFRRFNFACFSRELIVISLSTRGFRLSDVM